MKKYADFILNHLKKYPLDYAEVRFTNTEIQEIQVKNGILQELNQDSDSGYGIRVLFRGGWGFASFDHFDEERMLATADLAVEIARSTIVNRKTAIKLAPEPVHQDQWICDYDVDPFTIPLGKKIELLNNLDAILRDHEAIKVAQSGLYFKKHESWFFNSEGTEINQLNILSGSGYSATAVGNGDVQVRSYPASFGGQYKQGGYEVIEALNLLENAPKTRDEAVALLSAEVCPSGTFDLILHPNQLMLQIHESVGHPTELDRVLGQEANFAGTSFVTTEKYKNFQYGSKIVNLVADTTLPGGLATMGYDDDGVAAQKWHIVKDGIFNGYMTNRELAETIGEERSKGASRATSWFDLPIIRIANLSLMPGDSSLDEIIKNTKYGLFMVSNKSWSIDQQRLNFQFGCEIAYEVKDGKRTGKIFKNPTYQGMTPQFWGSCDMIAGKDEWDAWGVLQCGKGQPMQISYMSHGSAPARFKNITIGIKS